MIAYHVDTLRSLPKGRLDLSRNYNGFSPEIVRFCKESFPKGISRMGFIYTGVQVLSRDSDFSHVVSEIAEFAFELIRQHHYPNLPSRFQSIMACSTEAEANEWAHLLGANLRQYPVKCSPSIKRVEYSTAFKGDSYWRDCMMSPGGPIFSPGLLYSCAHNYWSGKRSQSPRIELVIPLPVTIL